MLPSPWEALYALIDAKGDPALSDYARAYIDRTDCYCDADDVWCFYRLTDDEQAAHIIEQYQEADR